MATMFVGKYHRKFLNEKIIDFSWEKSSDILTTNMIAVKSLYMYLV